MTTAELRIAVNGGAPGTGGITAPANATLAYSFTNTSGWSKYKLEIYGPDGFTPPPGWTAMTGGAYYLGTTSPPATVSLSGAPWGKYMHRLVVNDKIVDDATAVSILSPSGLEDLGSLEESQFTDAARGWAGVIQRILRTVETGIGGGPMPGVANVAGATIVESPAGTRVARRLKQSEVDPSFDITSWTKTAPNGSENIYRRGDTITAITATAAYTSGPPDSRSVTDSFGNGAADSGGGVWSGTGPAYTSWSRTGSVVEAGADGSSDPYWTATLNASADVADSASFTTYFASDVYVGETASGSIVGTDVFDGGALQAGFSDILDGATGKPLKRTRLAGGSSGYPTINFTFASPKYGWILWPNEAQYTFGTPVFKDQNGFTFAMIDDGTTTITRNGVTRTYKKYRTAGVLNSAFQVTVT